MSDASIEQRLLLALEALCDSLFSDTEFEGFRRACCNLESDKWHQLGTIFDSVLEELWREVDLTAPTIWVKTTPTPCHRWHICNLYCTELNAVIATAVLGWPDDVNTQLH